MPSEIKFFGDGLPYLKTDDLKGKLIAIEGTDGVGRSTQIDLLEEWLRVKGYGVVVTGWTRSNLMSKSIKMAKDGNMIDRMTLSLLYATDFADRLENQILPALHSGFIVLADRYIYTAFARDSARNPDLTWIKDVFGFAPIPHLICYLRLDVDNLIPRVIESGGMNYWESGVDLHLADNIFDSFKKYQKQLIDCYDNMAEDYQFKVVDARGSVEQIQQDLREHIETLLQPENQKEVPSGPSNKTAQGSDPKTKNSAKASQNLSSLDAASEVGARPLIEQEAECLPNKVPTEQAPLSSTKRSTQVHNPADAQSKDSSTARDLPTLISLQDAF